MVIDEKNISMESLAIHLENAGQIFDQRKDEIVAHSSNGLGFHLYLDEDRKFIIIRKFYPINVSFDDGLAFSNELNDSVFMGKFHIDDDGDLACSYAISYEKSLNIPQFMRTYHRFSSLVDYVVGLDTDGSIFDFNKKHPVRTPIEVSTLIQ